MAMLQVCPGWIEQTDEGRERSIIEIHRILQFALVARKKKLPPEERLTFREQSIISAGRTDNVICRGVIEQNISYAFVVI